MTTPNIQRRGSSSFRHVTGIVLNPRLCRWRHRRFWVDQTRLCRGFPLLSVGVGNELLLNLAELPENEHSEYHADNNRDVGGVTYELGVPLSTGGVLLCLDKQVLEFGCHSIWL